MNKRAALTKIVAEKRIIMKVPLEPVPLPEAPFFLTSFLSTGNSADIKLGDFLPY
jgi:hypothetical protein